MEACVVLNLHGPPSPDAAFTNLMFDAVGTDTHPVTTDAAFELCNENSLDGPVPL